jgi:hypothetical protein
MYYIRIQKFNRIPDSEFTSDSLGLCIKFLCDYIHEYPDRYRGHFIIKKDGTSF